MTPSALVLFLFICGGTPTHGSLVQLYHMVTSATGKKAIPYYSFYGCYCGLGGKGRPKDATDRCCQVHDCCYGWLQNRGCQPKTTGYSYSQWWGQIQCGRSGNWCQRGTCGCDRDLALCLKANKGQYRRRYTFHPNVLCFGSSPGC
ncbi:basic phospholipase A2 sphenotoxin subunit B-like [Candoia aspera]|uniref:basic phospholipase A2 sphenotoxin subunit B-like n=1 Tax=Candoia aspera TaxID=51853 RepID=UPI002FD83DD7